MFSPIVIEKAKNIHSSNASRFSVAGANSLPFDDNCFDAVAANMVFHLTTNLREVLLEASRVLTPKGELLFLTPAP